MKENQLNDYSIYLDMLNQKLNKFFKQQEEYLHCKAGCSHCCENGEYPCSELEFSFLKQGFDRLDVSLKNIILDKTKLLKIQKDKNPEKILQCECPFLIENKCAVYSYRPIICRTFGIPYFTEDDRLKVPFCHVMGLNYSAVYDDKTKMFSEEKFKATGFKQEPLAYNLSLKFLIGKVGKESMKLDFGEHKTITDWMIGLLD